MNDADKPATLALSQGDDLPERLWSFSELATDEDRAAADLATGLTSVGFIRAALRRNAWLWYATTVIGLLVGFAALKAFPPAHQASTEILLSSNLPGSPGVAAQDDAAIAQSTTVAGAALRRLGLPDNPVGFVEHYTVTVLTNRVLAITVKASLDADAVREANALAKSFLAFQAHQLASQQSLVDTALQNQITQDQRHISALNHQIARLSAQSASPAQQARLSGLVTRRRRARSALSVLQQSSLSNAASAKIQAVTQVTGSQVLDPAAPLPQHTKRYLLLYVGGGLIGGLVLGLAIVIIWALVSDKLRRRGDVARALGAPVRLSVGRIGASRWEAGLRWLVAARKADITESIETRRIVTYLCSVLPASSKNAATLAVVPVGDPRVPAFCLVSLATTCAQQGLQVIVADLCDRAPAARLLGVTEVGVEIVHVQDAPVVVVIPGRDELAPIGPRGGDRRAHANDKLTAAFASADVLLTLAPLDPSLGGGHLPTWADAAVAMVTAGQASAERIQVVGELIRLAGTELISAVLVGADSTDNSLGAAPQPGSLVSADLGIGS